jgi:glycosyltransferase involved in cell wall biosynthesis
MIDAFRVHHCTTRLSDRGDSPASLDFLFMSHERRHRHIVMIVANDVTSDSRVQKTAIAAAAAGFRVTVVGMSTIADRQEDDLQGATVIRVPVPFTLKKAAKARAAAEARAAPARITALRLRTQFRHRQHLSRIADLRARIDGLKRRGAGRVQIRLLWGALLITRRWARHRKALSERALRRREAAHARAATVAATRNWRDQLPALSDFELAYLDVLGELDFDLIHAHDYQMIACANHAAILSGRSPRVVYDAHEHVRGLPGLPDETLAAWVALEREHIRDVDAVITVSPKLSERLMRDHGLREAPRLVLNAPLVDRFDPSSELSVRAAAGVEDATPLIVYAGGVHPERGLATLVMALPLLPEAHCAIVTNAPASEPVQDLLDLAAEHGCADRIHIVPYVPQDEVVNYLRTADVGVHTILRSGNAEVALPNKLFEYLQAGVPMAVTAMPMMAELVREHGWGEVFAPGDHEQLAAAIERLLADPDAYRRRLADPAVRAAYSWERQAETLIATYDRLLGIEPVVDGVDSGAALSA